MSKDYTFSVMPSVSISRSRFARKSQHKTSFNLGQIIPIYCDEVLPGDTRSMDMAALVRMSNPIAPIMDNVVLDYFAFFTPCRLTWKHWKEFMGENSAGAGIPVQQYSIPYLGDNDYSVVSPGNGTGISVGSYGDYFGLPVEQDDVVGRNKISALPFRALALIYNRWFRNENLIAPLAVQDDDTNEVIVGELSGNNYSNFACDALSVLKASKLPDYFTKALPFAQKGSAVTIPLGTTAPVSLKLVNGVTMPSGSVTIGANGTGGLNATYQTISASQGGTTGTGNLIADLSNATAATINQLRYAFQLQKLLEKDALYGTRYWEILNAHFGVQAPDASLQDPEYLGGYRQHRFLYI